MEKKRPVNLNLLTIKFPIPAIVSILHRISGFLLFLLIPVLLWMLQLSLSSAEGLGDIEYLLDGSILKLIIWVFLAALVYHLLAGIRHLIMDLGIGERLREARMSAWLVIALSIIGLVLAGVWLW